MSKKKTKDEEQILCSSDKTEPTNDFDLTPDKKPAVSTIKQQIKDINFIRKKLEYIRKVKLITNFDRLKIWIDLQKYGKTINFKLGQNMEKCDSPSIPPYKRNNSIQTLYTRNNSDIPQDLCIDDAEDINYDYFDGYDEEIIQYEKRRQIYPNCAIKYKIYKSNIGINNVYIQNDILVIDITGKVTAEFGELGLLNITNIKEALTKLQNFDLFSFDNDKFLKYAGCYIADVTMDVQFPYTMQIKRMINAVGSFSPIISKDFYTNKYKRNGLLIKRKTKDAGCSFCLYSKREELSNSIKREDRKVKYTEIIGELGEQIARHTLRLETHIYKMTKLRELLNIRAKEKGVVLLKDILNSHEPVIINMIQNSGIDINSLYNSLNWYEAKTNLFKDENFISYEELKELAMAEWFTDLLVKNSFRMDVLKQHLIVEYNFDIEGKQAQRLMPKIKTNIYNYLCYRKPKTVTSVLLLIFMLADKYKEDAKVLKKEKNGRKKTPKVQNSPS